MACAKCRLPYPDDMVSPIIGVSKTYGEGYCGICALAITNEIHGFRRKRFSGEMADEARQRAVNWRRKHPNAQPVGEAEK